MKRMTSILGALALGVAVVAMAGGTESKAGKDGNETKATKMSCCAAKGAAAKTLAAGTGEQCAPGKTMAHGTKANAASCDVVSKTDVALTGKVLCESCDLKKKDTCAPVFQAEGKTETLPLCPETKDVDALKSASDHGKNVLDVKGVLCKTKDGRELLQVTSYSKKA